MCGACACVRVCTVSYVCRALDRDFKKGGIYIGISSICTGHINGYNDSVRILILRSLRYFFLDDDDDDAPRSALRPRPSTPSQKCYSYFYFYTSKNESTTKR